MAISPFPSQDLAKLVLGYLAEEQLMTAYDEFLQASPYLDAMCNEYDILIMMSLKNILAEYRAVKIYVATCKPLILRKKLYECTNLLEMVKFLLNHFDEKKLSDLEHENTISRSKLHKSEKLKLSTCDTCKTLKLTTCVCISKDNEQIVSNSLPVICQDETPIVNLVETTSLADLPGNQIQNQKRRVKVLDKVCADIQSNNISLQSEKNSKESLDFFNSEQISNLPNIENIQEPFLINVGLDTTILGSNQTETKQNTDELNDTDYKDGRDYADDINGKFSIGCKGNPITDKIKPNLNNKITFQDLFQDFASRTDGEHETGIKPVFRKRQQNCILNKMKNIVCEKSETHNPPIFLKTKNVKKKSFTSGKANVNTTNVNTISVNTGSVHTASVNTSNVNTTNPKKASSPKVKILSNVKVDNAFKNISKKIIPPIYKVTSTPLMNNMQTIVINDTPAYSTHDMNTKIFSEDEIMAMPTIIVVPSSGENQIPIISEGQTVTTTSQISTTTQSLTESKVLNSITSQIPTTQSYTDNKVIISITPQNTTTTQSYTESNVVSHITPQVTATQSHTENKVFSTLVIDTTSPVTVNSNESKTKVITNDAHEIGLVKTVDSVTNFKNASEPKDIVTSAMETSTPSNAPTTKKSSSTPRRTSHIRVLDFATPRRIFHDNENENLNENDDNISDDVTTKNPVTETINVNDICHEKDINKLNDKCNKSNKKQIKTEKSKILPKVNWDTKLREVITSNNDVFKPITNSSGNKKSNDTNESKETKKPQKPKKVKNKQDNDKEKSEVVQKKVIIQIKPNIKIKHAPDRNTTLTTCIEKKESKENENKTINEEQINTPEVDRLTLQNIMGAKLNISELLDTPYKQVLYDMQMETPKCLGPDYPGEPISDIKIMNIPTPRFFNSPITNAATPSCSSHPTDYSSGSSYYKPDEQDFVPTSDIKCVVTPPKEIDKIETIIENSTSNKKTSRPVRKCAKNVSYYNMIHNSPKIPVEKILTVALRRESINLNSRAAKSSKNKDTFKPEDKKKSSKKPKSFNFKEKSKAFVKIKPRRVTPTKDKPAARTRTKSFQNTSPKLHRKITSCKDNIDYSPITTVPTKSRRKSSTPRKIHCSKTINSSFEHNYTDSNALPNKDTNAMSTQVSDVEQLTLLWSDDGSQHVKISEKSINNDTEDISKIQEYIETTVLNKPAKEGVLQKDLINRGFDEETAKNIERDLMGTPPQNDINRTYFEKPNEASNQCDDDNDEIQLSLYECNEETSNFVVFKFDDTKETSTKPPITFKDKYSVEVCIDDDVTVRLRATPVTLLYDFNLNIKETEEAVNSILSMDKLYTPLKARINARVYDIFDSTLTSLDTPLKDNSPKSDDLDRIVSGIVSEDKTDLQKRKRNFNVDSEKSPVESKKAKPDAQYLLSSTNIQNIDIETVLTKLHGP